MNDSLRLYFESVVRLATCSQPNTMSDQELVGVVGLLPSPAVGYSEWAEKVGISKEPEQQKTGPLTDEEAGALNDRFLERMRLMELNANGNGNPE